MLDINDDSKWEQHKEAKCAKVVRNAILDSKFVEAGSVLFSGELNEDGKHQPVGISLLELVQITVEIVHRTRLRTSMHRSLIRNECEPGSLAWHAVDGLTGVRHMREVFKELYHQFPYHGFRFHESRWEERQHYDRLEQEEWKRQEMGAFEDAWHEAMLGEEGFADWAEEEINRRYSTTWRSLTLEQQHEVRSEVYKEWMVYYHKEWAIPNDYKQWLGHSLPGLRPCWYFMRGDCRYGDACKFLHEVQGTTEMGLAEGSSADAERGAESRADMWTNLSGQDVRCEDQDSGLSEAMLEIGMGDIEASTTKGEAGLMNDGQKAKGFAFKTMDGSALAGNKPTEAHRQGKRTEREIYKDPEFRRLQGKVDKGRKVDGAVVTKRQRQRQATMQRLKAKLDKLQGELASYGGEQSEVQRLRSELKKQR